MDCLEHLGGGIFGDNTYWVNVAFIQPVTEIPDPSRDFIEMDIFMSAISLDDVHLAGRHCCLFSSLSFLSFLFFLLRKTSKCMRKTCFAGRFQICHQFEILQKQDPPFFCGLKQVDYYCS